MSKPKIVFKVDEEGGEATMTAKSRELPASYDGLLRADVLQCLLGEVQELYDEALHDLEDELQSIAQED